MTKSEIREAALRLSFEQQLELARELWENTVPDPIELSPELREMLQARLEEARTHPEDGIPWEEVHARIRQDQAERRKL